MADLNQKKEIKRFCPNCGIRLRSPQYKCKSMGNFYFSDEVVKDKSGRQRCPECHSLVELISQAINEGETPFKCRECNFTFNGKENWGEAIKRAQDIDGNLVSEWFEEIDISLEGIESPEEFSIRQDKPRDQREGYKCPECGGLMDLATFICPECGTKFTDFEELPDQFLDTHPDEPQMPATPAHAMPGEGHDYECPSCGKHAREYDKACQSCGVKFTDFNELPDEITERHLCEPEKPAIPAQVMLDSGYDHDGECPSCGKLVNDCDKACQSPDVTFQDVEEFSDEIPTTFLEELEKLAIHAQVMPDGEGESECPRCGRPVSEIDMTCLSCGVTIQGYEELPDGTSESSLKRLDELIEVINISSMMGNEMVGELKDSPKCPKCTGSISPSDRFCSKCGMILVVKVQKGQSKITDFLRNIQNVTLELQTSNEPDIARKKLISLDKEIAKNLSNDKLWFSRGVLLSELGILTKALRSFDTVIRLNPENKNVWIAKANVLGSLNRIEEASVCYHKAFEITASKDKGKSKKDDKEMKKPKKPEKKEPKLSLTKDVGLSKEAVTKGQLPTPDSSETIRKRLKALDKKIADDVTNDKLWFSRGLLLSELGILDKALKSFDTVIKLNPVHKKAWMAKANILGTLNRVEEASECYRKAFDIPKPIDAEKPKIDDKDMKRPKKLLKKKRLIRLKKRRE